MTACMQAPCRVPFWTCPRHLLTQQTGAQCHACSSGPSGSTLCQAAAGMCHHALRLLEQHVAQLVEAFRYSALLTASYKQARCMQVARGADTTTDLLLPRLQQHA